MQSGVLVVNKAAGATSFDAVAIARRRLGVRRVGHAGTLDPAATGVLPVLIGEATKLTPYLMDQSKEYVAVLRFGVTTDTGDLEGRVVSRSPVASVSREQLAAVCRRFVGPIQQVPPMYSAIHHKGRRLYEWARAGVELSREPRDVIIYSIVVEATEGTAARVRIVCGKGMYVRALAADIGRELDCGAALENLERVRVGPFTMVGALTWTALLSDPPEAVWSKVLVPESALSDWPVVCLDADAELAFRQGQAIRIEPGTGEGGSLCRVHGRLETFLGIGQIVAAQGKLKPVRLLHANRSGPHVVPA